MSSSHSRDRSPKPTRVLVKPGDLKLKLEISTPTAALVQGVDWFRFVDYAGLAAAVEQKLADDAAKSHKEETRRNRRILKLIKETLPQAVWVKWEEDGSLEEVGISQPFRGSRAEAKSQFNTTYFLSCEIGIATPEDPDCKEGETTLHMIYSASLDYQLGLERIYFMWDKSRLSLHWQGSIAKPTAQQIRHLISELATHEVIGSEGDALRKELAHFNVQKALDSFSQ